VAAYRGVVAGRSSSPPRCSFAASARRAAHAICRAAGRHGASRRVSPRRSGPRSASGAPSRYALTVCFARALARRGWFARDSDDRDDRRASSRRCCALHLLSGRQALWRPCSIARQLRAGARGERLFTDDIWGIGCLGGGTRCGVAINSALLA
jgi:hypothetical protein